MKLDIPDEYLPLIVNAPEHYHAYTRAAQLEDARYQQAAEWFKRKRQPASEAPERTTKRRRAQHLAKDERGYMIVRHEVAAGARRCQADGAFIQATAVLEAESAA